MFDHSPEADMDRYRMDALVDSPLVTVKGIISDNEYEPGVADSFEKIRIFRTTPRPAGCLAAMLRISDYEFAHVGDLYLKPETEYSDQLHVYGSNNLDRLSRVAEQVGQALDRKIEASVKEIHERAESD